jgi:hypothetical protein
MRDSQRTSRGGARTEPLEAVVNGCGARPRSYSEIQRDLAAGGYELEKKPSNSRGVTLPLLLLLAAGGVGYILTRRSRLPAELAGRVLELAAPVVVPMLLRSIRPRRGT